MDRENVDAFGLALLGYFQGNTSAALVIRRDDGVDAAILVANCPVCHQSIALTARALEEAGIATVVMGCAKDIVEHVGVPRLLFSDFPLGNAAGRPRDQESQAFPLLLRKKYNLDYKYPPES